MKKCLHIKPAAGVVEQAGEFPYHSTNNDPQFLIQGMQEFAGSWVELEFDLKAHPYAFSQPVLYIDSGAGYSEQQSYRLACPDESTRVSKTIFRLPTAIQSARLDPIAEKKQFAISGVAVTRLNQFQALAGIISSIRAQGQFRDLLRAVRDAIKVVPFLYALRATKNAIYSHYLTCLSQSSRSYKKWLTSFETPEKNYAELRKNYSTWTRLPLISVIMPVYNAPPEFLEQAIESVRDQIYPHWELCIADDASTNEKTKSILKKYAMEDKRIKVVFRAENGHISAATNSAFEISTGEFIALLDHDDMLHPLALHHLAETINRHSDAELIYSDEDRIDESNYRSEPYFKCEFNYELMLAQNMLNHLSCYRRAIVGDVGAWRKGFEGSQDYDLALRVIERLKPHQIVHIPRVLYHWRAIEGSTAHSADAKPYATIAAQRAIREHLNRMGVEAEVVDAPKLPTWSRVKFKVPEPQPGVCIIIPTRDRVDLLSTCISSILEKTTYKNYRILIVDNNSVEAETLAYFDKVKSEVISILKDDRPFNYSALNNGAVEACTSEYVCLMNNDIEVISPDWLEEMMGHACRTGVGAVGARLWYPDGRLQHGGLIMGLGGTAGHSHKFLPKNHPGYFGRAALHQAFSGVTAAVLLIKKSIYQEAGGLEEKFAVAFNDVDFCLKVDAKGYRNVWTPYAEFIHYESATRGYETTPEKQRRMNAEAELLRERWGQRLFNDRYYSPNLTQEEEDFSLAWPPRFNP
ncbi:MAG: glycosyltransferase [Burkholderiales bacterium]|nr:glycosyltransferase [Burkholderiales bacterium]